MSQKVSFTVRRPTPVSRDNSSGPESDGSGFKVPGLPRHLKNESVPGSPLAQSASTSPRRYIDSSDEEDEEAVELVDEFDKIGGARRSVRDKAKAAPKGPLVIQPAPNRDWRELARRRRGQFVPASAAATTGADGSVGGLGTRDTINTGPVLAGLQVKHREVKVEGDDVTVKEEEETTAMAVDEETDDQKALRAILATADGRTQEDGPVIDVIRPVSEAEALKQDVDELPDQATLEDYERVPVSQFGAALLRGMGWKEGMAATRKPGRGMVEPYMPEARPALLGIGAKEQEVYDDGSKKPAYKKRPDKRYVPVIKKEREESQPRNDRERDGKSERRRDRSYSPRRSDREDRRGDRDDKYRSRDRDRDDKYRDRDDKYREDKYKDRDDKYRDRDSKYRDRDDSKYREREDSSRRKEKDYHDDRERRRDRSRDATRRRRDY
uniref:G-patch domain-containing protein n=1 Tax=Schizophyllum commune (strain H4-8 / FGSC 9210) TaxID=578458 RepID=D8Q9K7_SCHCM